MDGIRRRYGLAQWFDDSCELLPLGEVVDTNHGTQIVILFKPQGRAPFTVALNPDGSYEIEEV